MTLCVTLHVHITVVSFMYRLQLTCTFHSKITSSKVYTCTVIQDTYKYYDKRGVYHVAETDSSCLSIRAKLGRWLASFFQASCMIRYIESGHPSGGSIL